MDLGVFPTLQVSGYAFGCLIQGEQAISHTFVNNSTLRRNAEKQGNQPASQPVSQSAGKEQGGQAGVRD
jgi:hypothetical protein